ncbi:MAG: branched-chain amino acid ABC transporter substrate-binding protein, partial [Paracoccaceae bacterium]|nr:branched-chain amino acid ABC transporter substrate-binding protein [Paracoccaceae bacterium]
MIRVTALIAALMLLPLVAAAKDAIILKTAVLKIDNGPVLPLSRLDLPAENDGFAGAAVGLADNNTTGRFLGQTFEATEVTAKPEDAIKAAEVAVADGAGVIVALAPEATLLALADHFADQNTIILNATARDDALRNASCRANVLHVAPSRAMLADGLAQYMVWKKWTEWMLIHG